MKVAIVAPYFHPVKGGRERTVYYIAKGLRERGHKVIVITGNRTTEGKEIEDFPENYPFEVLRIRTLHLAFRAEIPTENPKKILKVLSDVDVVNIVSTDTFFTFQILLLAKILRKPVFVTVFTPFALLKHPKKILRPFMLIFEIISILAMKMASVVQVKNEFDLEIAKKFTRNVVLIPDGIPGEFINARPKVNFREVYGLQDKKIILFVNRIHPLKGPQILISAMPEILKTFPNAVAVLIGPDTANYTAELRKLAEELGISESVMFLGFVDEEMKIAAYDAADVVVIPSVGEFTEAFSIVLSEAWARGKTVVVSESRALRSRVKGHGYIFRGYDAKNLAKAVKEALKSPKDAPKVHSWDEVVEMMEKVYNKLGHIK